MSWLINDKAVSIEIALTRDPGTNEATGDEISKWIYMPVTNAESWWEIFKWMRV